MAGEDSTDRLTRDLIARAKSTSEDLYAVLGLPSPFSPGAEPTSAKASNISHIRKAWRTTALRYHPDKNPDSAAAAQKYEEARLAFEILDHETARAAYDEHQRVQREKILREAAFEGKRRAMKETLERGEEAARQARGQSGVAAAAAAPAERFATRASSGSGAAEDSAAWNDEERDILTKLKWALGEARKMQEDSRAKKPRTNADSEARSRTPIGKTQQRPRPDMARILQRCKEVEAAKRRQREEQGLDGSRRAGNVGNRKPGKPKVATDSREAERRQLEEAIRRQEELEEASGAYAAN